MPLCHAGYPDYDGFTVYAPAHASTIRVIESHVQRLHQLLVQRELGMRSMSTVVELTMTRNRLAGVLLGYPVWIGVVCVAMMAIPVVTVVHFLHQPRLTVQGKAS